LVREREREEREKREREREERKGGRINFPPFFSYTKLKDINKLNDFIRSGGIRERERGERE